jgi:hypothetical protein
MLRKTLEQTLMTIADYCLTNVSTLHNGGARVMNSLGTSEDFSSLGKQEDMFNTP